MKMSLDIYFTVVKYKIVLVFDLKHLTPRDCIA